jgi:hypothetical protein
VRHPHQPGGPVHRRTEIITLTRIRDTGVNPDSNLDTLIFWQGQIQLQELALDLNSGTHSRPRIWEFGHCGIANRLNYCAFKLLDGTRGHFIVAMDHDQASRIAIALKEAGRANYIGKQDRQGIFVLAELFIDLSSCL